MKPLLCPELVRPTDNPKVTWDGYFHLSRLQNRGRPSSKGNQLNLLKSKVQESYSGIAF